MLVLKKVKYNIIISIVLFMFVWITNEFDLSENTESFLNFSLIVSILVLMFKIAVPLSKILIKKLIIWLPIIFSSIKKYFKSKLGIKEILYDLLNFIFITNIYYIPFGYFSWLLFSHHVYDIVFNIWALLFVSLIVLAILYILCPKNKKEVKREKEEEQERDIKKHQDKLRIKKENKRKIEIYKRIDLLYTEQINKKYMVIQSISKESKKGFNDLRNKIRLTADNLGGDAIIGIKESTSSDTSGHIRGQVTNSNASAFLGDNIEGETNTEITYYITGTIIKYVSSEELNILEWNEDKHYSNMLKFQELFDKKLISKEEFDKKIIALNEIKEKALKK